MITVTSTYEIEPLASPEEAEAIRETLRETNRPALEAPSAWREAGIAEGTEPFPPVAAR